MNASWVRRMRCIPGALLLSAVVGLLTYGMTQNQIESRERELKVLAMKACIDLGPPGEETDPVAMQAQLDLCTFGHSLLIKENQDGR